MKLLDPIAISHFWKSPNGFGPHIVCTAFRSIWVTSHFFVFQVLQLLQSFNHSKSSISGKQKLVYFMKYYSFTDCIFVTLKPYSYRNFPRFVFGTFQKMMLGYDSKYVKTNCFPIYTHHNSIHWYDSINWQCCFCSLISVRWTLSNSLENDLRIWCMTLSIEWRKNIF